MPAILAAAGLTVHFIHIPFYKRLLSYFYPVRIKRTRGDVNPYLEVLLWYNRCQLATADALYSDGDKYVPAITAVKALADSLPQVRNVLVLGTGLGSMVTVLRKQGCRPAFTLVEKDKAVLQMAMELLGAQPGGITPVCEDAAVFMQRNKEKFDLVFIDVFLGRMVPDFVCSQSFLLQCREALTTNGHVAFNYIVNDEAEWQTVKDTFAGIFPQYEVHCKRVNRVLIGA